jgi:glycosyltransferase involved in cell wall biosynthesis
VKILYQHRTLADGAEGVHIREMVDAFRGLGHDVSIRTVAGAARAPAPFVVWVKRRLPAAAFELAAILCNVADYWKTARALRRHRPDLVYKRHALHDFGVVLAAKRHGVPVVVEVNAAYSSAAHQRFERIRFRRLALLAERAALRHASLVVAVSTPLRQIVERFCTSPDRAMVLPNGANPDRFRFDEGAGATVRRRYGLADGPIIGWAGILREWHRVDLLIEAMALVPEARLLIIGDGPDRPRLEDVAHRLGIADRVVFTGRVPHADMAAHIAAVDVAVASHDQTGYASPMKLLEYMAMSRAVVAPRLPNIEDFIDDGVDGVLFTPGSREALAEALRRLLADAGLRRDMGRRARAKIERERNWRRNAEIVVNRLNAAAARP